MKKILLLLLLLSAIGGLLSAAEKSVYSCSFAPEELAGWKIPPAFAKVETVDGAPALRVTVKPGMKRKNSISQSAKSILRPYRGNQLFLTYEVKGENVSVPPEQWNGVKLMLHFKTPQEEVWRGAGAPPGVSAGGPLRRQPSSPPARQPERSISGSSRAPEPSGCAA